MKLLLCREYIYIYIYIYKRRSYAVYHVQSVDNLFNIKIIH